ncbi:MAG: PD40 domain-containing protein [Flavobacteriales bacterium]|nr:PD40 domain-containing protein [Flavobacteriales bacterium]
MRKNVLLLILVFHFFGFAVQAQKDEKKIGKVGYKIKMQDARHKFLAEGNVRASLNIYRDLLQDYTNDAMVNYRIAECHFKLKNYELAVEYFQNARKLNDEVDKELHYNLGRAYHRNDQLDKSIESYNTFNETASKKTKKNYDVAGKIAQVDYAKKMIANPVKVKIENLGKNINSKGGDYSPSISADGKTMIFTSRRSDTKGGGVDKAGDYKYFEDIYIADWDSVDNKWNKAHPIEGKLNTEGHDASLSISPDGNKIFIYRNDGSLYIGDIFVSKKRRSSGTWGNPKALEKPVNTSYFESSACLSADGNKLYFVSEKEGKKYGALGRGDIYVAEKITKSTWGEPKNLGSVINTSSDENNVFIHPDGKTLFFSSNGHLSIGGYDVFMSKMQDDGTWGKPENLGYPINTILDDVHFTLSVDGKTAHYSAVREGGLGERDIYKIDMSEYPILSDGVSTSLSILKGVVKSGEDKIAAKIEFSNTKGIIVGKTSSDEDGNYFITLTGGNIYYVNITAKGYKSKNVEVNLAAGKGNTHEQLEVFEMEKIVGVE